VPWWGWLVASLGTASVAIFAMRQHIRYALRVTKALATDPRLPRGVRWGLKAALAIKMVPVPDLGIDEVMLLVIGILLVTVYRPTLRAILAESRTAPANDDGVAGGGAG
jgi:hypothetical protein